MEGNAMAELNIQELIEKFEQLLTSVKRDGIDKLLAYIRKSDFYRAPASTRFHSCHDGGLLEHSLNLYECLLSKKQNPIWAEVLREVDDESLILVALLHDLCKSYLYVPEFKNKKVYSDTGTKKDEGGRFDWQAVKGYSTDDKIPYGHGEKSVMMIEEFIKLKPIERYAIRWHMGFTEPKEYWNTLTTAIKKYPVILAVHQADMEATYLLEEEE
ncbi:MAG: hypothetical protein IJ421_10400 [Prevotella sp.]|nr:hypothetical protein [Prevotella sp.]